MTLENLPDGEYYFDVISSDKNNWQYPFGHFAEKGLVNNPQVFISYNINGIISDADGENWRITAVADALGNDLSSNPQYEHWIDNIQTFTKAGYFASDKNEMGNAANIEGSWWGSGAFHFAIMLNGFEITDYYVTTLASDSFDAFYHNENFEEIHLHYERNQ